jgi:hypothetical protein
VVVYGDAQQAGKAPFLVELAHIIQKTRVPIMITGDFNLTRRASDKNKPGGFNKWSVLFNSIIAQGELMEIPLSGRRYTWSNNHEDPTFELLDRVLVSPTWEENFPLVTVSTLTRDLSDHTPLLITTGEQPKTPPIFRFENCWFEREGLIPLVTQVWRQTYRGKSIEDIWMKRFRTLRQKLKGWNRNVEGANRKQKKLLIDEIDKLDKISEVHGLSAADRAAQKTCHEGLRALIREEEIKWMQRAKEIHLKEGDGNSRFFHQKANGRRRKNLIVRLNQDEGIVEGQENLKRYITEFYKKLFGRSEVSSITLDPTGVEQISEADKKILTDPFNLEEVKQAVFGMEPNKAAGPDGFNAEFY